MFDRLRELVAEGDTSEALFELQEEYLHIDELSLEEAANLCVLEATIWEQLYDGQAEIRAIEKGLNYDGGNYELFYMLGVYYRYSNLDKAYLCFEMAYFYCKNAEDAQEIKQELDILKADPAMRVRGLCIMILSYNDLEVMKECLLAIEKYQPLDDLEVVVVDNASTLEGVSEFLQEKKNSACYSFKLMESSENLGFPAGCNLGAAMADENKDILFLNNDAVVSRNALFWLRMGLYDNRNVGAVGAATNCARGQELSPAFFEEAAGIALKEGWHRELGLIPSLDIFEKAAGKSVCLSRRAYEKRFRLVGFAVMVSREALRAVAPDNKVFDEKFFPGYFEDDDLGIRIALAGYDQYLCKNAFVFHNGGSGFSGHNDAMETNRERFREKWGFDSWEYAECWEEAVLLVEECYKQMKRPLRVIDFSCGFGATASMIKERFPEFFVAGVCKNAFAAGIAKHMADEVTFGNPNLCNLPWKDRSFDIVMGEKASISSGRVLQCLAPGGVYINEEGVSTL